MIMFLKRNFTYEKKVLVSVLSGSRAYGTNVENSDYDIRGIFIASKRENISIWINSTS